MNTAGLIAAVLCILFGVLMGLLLAWAYPRIETWWIVHQADREVRLRFGLPQRPRRRRLFPQLRFPW
jgi:hypothetical protein